MSEIYFDPVKVEQRTDELQLELRHVRQFLQLIHQCRAKDPEHRQELDRSQKRLEDMERYLVQLIAALQDAVVRYRQLCTGMQVQLEENHSEVRHLYA